jgi:hypothetical protein
MSITRLTNPRRISSAGIAYASGTYSDYVYSSLRSGLVAYWPLNETAASGDVTAVDESGRGNNLTSNNSVLSTTGKIGNARDFVAANSEFLSITSNADMQFGDKDWSIALWFFVTGSWTNGRMIFGKDINGGREVECGLSTSGGNRILPVFYHSGGSQSDILGNSIALDTWHFLAFRHINSTGVITGRLNTSTNTYTRPSGQTWNSTGTAFHLGSRAFAGAQGYFGGRIDECARWSRALSNTELDELYNSGNGINLGQR